MLSSGSVFFFSIQNLEIFFVLSHLKAQKDPKQLKRTARISTPGAELTLSLALSEVFVSSAWGKPRLLPPSFVCPPLKQMERDGGDKADAEVEHQKSICPTAKCIICFVFPLLEYWMDAAEAFADQTPLHCHDSTSPSIPFSNRLFCFEAITAEPFQRTNKKKPKYYSAWKSGLVIRIIPV